MAKRTTESKASKASRSKKSDAALLSMRGETDWFIHDRFGLFIHWGLYAVGGRHEWLKKHDAMTDERYQRYFDFFDPDLYDPAAWARTARAAGMKYAVITTKHHEGFCMWDSAHTDYKATNTRAGRDLIREFVDAFRAEGLRVGFYHSLIDWHHPHYPIDHLHPQSKAYAIDHVGPSSPTGTIDKFAEINKKRDIKKYRKYLHAQVRELMSDYGKIDVAWFDFSFEGPTPEFPNKGREEWDSEGIVKMVRTLQPHIIINNRLDLPEAQDIVTPEQYQPSESPKDDKGNRVVWEACQTFSGSWGYHRDEENWKGIRMLLWMLIDSVSKGGNLLLNVGPTARGEFDYRAMNALEGIGAWMHLHGRAVYGCTQSEFTPPQDCRYTQNGDRLYVHCMNWPFRALHLPDLAGKVAYAQLLNDASEIFFSEGGTSVNLTLPVKPPPVEIPVIELFLK